MADVTILSVTFDSDRDWLVLTVDLSGAVLAPTDGTPLPGTILLTPEAVGNRIAGGAADGDAALRQVVLEHVVRLGGDAATTVVWQSPSDQQKASQLDALADRIEAARVFFS